MAVQLTASHCSACRRLFPKLVKLAAEEYRDVLFVKVVACQSQQLAEALGAHVFPTLVLFQGARGRVAEFSASLSTLHKVRQQLNEWRSGVPGLLEGDHPDWPQAAG